MQMIVIFHFDYGMIYPIWYFFVLILRIQMHPLNSKINYALKMMNQKQQIHAKKILTRIYWIMVDKDIKIMIQSKLFIQTIHYHGKAKHQFDFVPIYI